MHRRGDFVFTYAISGKLSKKHLSVIKVKRVCFFFFHFIVYIPFSSYRRFISGLIKAFHF